MSSGQQVSSLINSAFAQTPEFVEDTLIVDVGSLSPIPDGVVVPPGGVNGSGVPSGPPGGQNGVPPPLEPEIKEVIP